MPFFIEYKFNTGEKQYSLLNVTIGAKWEYSF